MLVFPLSEVLYVLPPTHTHTRVCVCMYIYPHAHFSEQMLVQGSDCAVIKTSLCWWWLTLTEYALWSLGHCKHLTLLIQAGADEKNLPGWWKLRPWLSKPKTQGSPIVAGRGAGAKKTLTHESVFRDLREWVGRTIKSSENSLENPGCVCQLFDSISVSRGESQNGNSPGLIDFCASCSPLESLEIFLNPQRIGAKTKILFVKLLEQIKCVLRKLVDISTLYRMLFKLIATWPEGCSYQLWHHDEGELAYPCAYNISRCEMQCGLYICRKGSHINYASNMVLFFYGFIQ